MPYNFATDSAVPKPFEEPIGAFAYSGVNTMAD